MGKHNNVYIYFFCLGSKYQRKDKRTKNINKLTTAKIYPKCAIETLWYGADRVLDGEVPEHSEAIDRKVVVPSGGLNQLHNYNIQRVPPRFLGSVF